MRAYRKWSTRRIKVDRKVMRLALLLCLCANMVGTVDPITNAIHINGF